MAKPSPVAADLRHPSRAAASGAALRRRWRGAQDTLHGYLFLAPFLFFFLVFLVYPVTQGFWISLHNWDLLGVGVRWAGLGNYERLIADRTFWSSLWHTVLFVLLTVPSLVLLGLFLAIAINRSYRGIGLFRTLLYLPAVLSVSVITTVWLRAYDPIYGLVGRFFGFTGLEPTYAPQDPTWAMLSVAVPTIWWTVGGSMLIFLAGLQDISPSLYEAASLDGAGRWATFRHITLPGLRRPMTFVIVIQTIAAFQIFGQVLNITKGGPVGSTRTIVLHIYEVAFRDYQLGYGSAMSFVLFGILFVLSLVQLRFFIRSEASS